MANIMQFQVRLPLQSADESCDPVHGGCNHPAPLARLTDKAGGYAHGVKVDKMRQLISKEFESEGLFGAPGAPAEDLVNNTEWDGMRSPCIASLFAKTDGVSEPPRQGSIKLWEITNLTGDAHPIHTHLTQFQVLNRQN